MSALFHIMVVEDDTGIREALVDTLVEEGYRVTAAVNGVDAFRQLQHEAKPCLILLDLMMPVMTGWEFVMRLRQQPELVSIPVVILSAVAEFQRGRPAFADMILLPKPVSVDQLLAMVEQTCNEQRHRPTNTPSTISRVAGAA